MHNRLYLISIVWFSFRIISTIECHLDMVTVMVIEIQVFQVFQQDVGVNIGAGMSIGRIYHLEISH